MIASRGKIHLRHRGVHIPQHGKILHLLQLQGAQAAVPHPGDSAVAGKLRWRRDIAVPVPLTQFSQLRLHILKAVQQSGGKASALAVQNHVEGLFMGNGFLIHPVRCKGVVRIHNRYGLGADGNGIPAQPVRIPPAVPALMMVAADVIGILQVFLIAHTSQALQNLASLDRMGLHDFKLFLCKTSRLVKNLILNGNLADIVKGRGRSNDLYLFLIQPVLRTVPAHLLQKHPRKQADALDVLSRLQASVLNDRRQGIHQHIIGFPQFPGLLAHHVFQIMFVKIEFNNIMYPPFDHMGLKGLDNDVGSPQIKGPQLSFQGIIRRDYHHRHLVQKPIGPHLLQHPVSVHHRHHHIQQHDCNILMILPQQKQRLLPVLSLQQMVFLLKQSVQNHAVYLHIIHNQYGIPLTHIVTSSPQPSDPCCR